MLSNEPFEQFNSNARRTRALARLFETSAPHAGNDAVILTNCEENSCAAHGTNRVIARTH